MKTWTKTTLAVALAVAASVGSAAVFARGGDCESPGAGKAGWQRMSPEHMQEGMPGQMVGQMAGRMAGRMAERAEVSLARLELALALAPDQKPAWDAFKSEMQARTASMVEQMAGHMAERRSAGSSERAVERLQRMEEMGKARQQMITETRKAVEGLYATLSDAQKTVFDAEFARMGPGRHGMGHGRG